MDQPDHDKSPTATEDGSHLNRNRSFKSKQLVRSQAIRESQSPPRTSPIPPGQPAAHDNNINYQAIITSDISVPEKNATTDATGNVGVTKNTVATSRAVSPTILSCVTKSAPATSPSVSPTIPSCVTKSVVATPSFTNRAVSPTAPICVTKSASEAVTPAACVTKNAVIVKVVNIDSDRTLDKVSETSSHERKCEGVNERGDGKKQSVEIQITPGAWDSHQHTEQRQRTQRWLQTGHHSDCRADLLSNNPRVSCVCSNCPHCRGARRKPSGPSKQDSGIGAGSDDCPDCSDTEPSGGSTCEGLRKTRSVELEPKGHTCRCSDRKDKPKNINLSRNDSEDYTKQELHGKDLVNFIKHTLNKNSRDRMTMLKIEKELHMLVNDTGRNIVRFPVMSSYGRLLVHRCAALFQLAHHLDPNNKTCVLVSKNGTSGGRIPCTSFKSWCTVNFPASPHHMPQQDATQAKSILKRDALSLDEAANGANGGANSRSKSLEQREKEYERVRRRIFSTDNCTSDESQWPWLTGQVKVLTPEPGSRKLLKVQSLEAAGGPSGWRRARVSKSHSFGGLGGDEPARLLSRQGDLASSSWRLSPSSSGYKTLSLRSTDSVTPSPTGGVSPEPCVSAASVTDASAPLVWCVTDLSSIPPGALIIHPQSGQALTNPDGSVYRYDPANPPVVYDSSDDQNKVEQNGDKRRGRLEKQHSFIDIEYECPGEECRTKGCYCEGDRADASCQNNVSDKSIQQPEPIQQQPPPSSQCQPEPPANHSAPSEPSTNQAAAYDAAANHAPFQAANQNQEYVQYRNEEELQQLTSQPQLLASYAHTEPPMVKTTVSVQDPNLRPPSLTGAPPPGYAYQQLYPAVATEEHKPEPAFRIDACYPYAPAPVEPYASFTQPCADAPVEPYASFTQPCAAACSLDPNTLHHRGYPVSYGQLEHAGMPAAYPLGNVMVPPPMQQYSMQTYQPVQWVPAAVHKPASPPVYLPPDLYQHQLYPVQYQYYQQPSGVYQQMMPQYQICQPVYLPDTSAGARRSPLANCNVTCRSRSIPPPRPPSAPSARPAPRPAPPPAAPRGSTPRDTGSGAHRSETSLSRQNSTELAIKIQQIKEQMASLNTQDSAREKPDRSSSRHERRPQEDNNKGRRNNGSGLLGNYPAGGGYHNRSFGRPHVNDESQLSSAARAIVDSIRNMQSKSNPLSDYHDNRRNCEHHNKSYHNRSENYHNRSENYQNRSENYHSRTENYQNRPENYQNARNRTNQPEKDQKPEENDVKPIEDVVFMNDKMERPGQARIDPSVLSRHRPVNPVAPFPYRQPYMTRQMPPGTWCRRSPGPAPPHLNGPRRAPPDSRLHRRQ